MLNFLYNTVLGRLILKILTRPFVSKLAGSFMDSALSVPFIKPFIKKNNISLEDYVIAEWKSFNEFFTRATRPQARIFDLTPSSLVSPCDGLLTVYNIDSSLKFTVKNSVYSIETLLENSALAKEYNGGLCLVFRLTPSHYHRYHYFDNGKKGENIFIPGVLHTVQPLAVENIPVYTRNSREYTVLETENFGDAVFMEIGAMMVGRIVNHHKEHQFIRGEEKGCFQFGGSTIIVLLKKDTVKISDEIINSLEEYPVLTGQKIGFKI